MKTFRSTAFTILLLLIPILCKPAFGQDKLVVIPEKYEMTPDIENIFRYGLNYIYEYYDAIFPFDDDFKVKVRIFGDFKDYMKFHYI